ncbi:MAG: GGDEF domain-containing protein [Planctomycetes bacterium]|nr:GGDEF domain-containing protein [Planctomycetota bacterium]
MPATGIDITHGGTWLWGALSVLVTAALAFAAGVAWGRAQPPLSARVRREAGRLAEALLAALETAREASVLLADTMAWRFGDDFAQRLSKSRQRLADSLESLDARLDASDPHQESAERPEARPLQVEWAREPEDPVTRLPARPAFELNLQTLADAVDAADSPAGILLVRIDHVARLRGRAGPAGLDAILERAARLLCRALREGDLVCRTTDDTFAILLAGIDAVSGERLARKIRNLLREHRFHVPPITKGGPGGIEDVGREVLVTVSLGYARVRAGEGAEVALSRAESALATSQRRGRNQLHVHDGTRIAHCTAV